MTHHEDCEFCTNKFSNTVLKDYQNWEIQLFLNQHYLGRTLIKLKRHAVDLTDLEKEEREELFEEILPKLKQATDKLFNPDLYNHATLGNDCRHFHLHFIPRYKSERIFNGEKFKDKNWNREYNLPPTEQQISEETFEKLENKMSVELQQ